MGHDRIAFLLADGHVPTGFDTFNMCLFGKFLRLSEKLIHSSMSCLWAFDTFHRLTVWTMRDTVK